MHIKNLFRFTKKRTAKEFQVKKLKRQKPVAVGEMAAGNLSAASNDITRMMEQQNMATKILAVQDGEHSTALVDYAVKMAQKLDCEIIALDVSEEPLRHTGDRKKREINRFNQRAQSNAETMRLKAETMGVKCKHIIRVGNQEATIKALSKDDKSIRYVLIKPEQEQEQVSVSKRQARVPVVDLNCSSL